MKKIYTVAAAMAVCLGAAAQTFSDDFESYNAGDYLAQSSSDWDTWSGSTGGITDVQIVDTEAASGSNSVYFSSTSSAGGPADIVLPFGDQYVAGEFLIEWAMKLEANKGFYFNFQENTSPGNGWALDAYFNQNGEMYLNSKGTSLIASTVPTDAWFNFRLDADLSTNTWELYIDGTSVGTFSLATDKIASLNLYPVNAEYGGNNQAGCWLDDMQFSYTPMDTLALNGAVTNIDVQSGLGEVDAAPIVTVRNLGTTNISSFNIAVTHDGATLNETVSGVSLAPLERYKHEFASDFTLASGVGTVAATISNVNALGADEDPSDDTKTMSLDLVVPADDKHVVVEEGTGTWCQWCPRGAVMMDRAATRYPEYFIGIAVHNGDPMTDSIYDAHLGELISGYPSVTIERVGDNDPSSLEGLFLDAIQVAPAARISLQAELNSEGDLKVAAKTQWLEAQSGDWRVAFVITEDDVTGTTADYAQSNAYANNANGEMGGYESLPNPVPASMMVYDHVARTIEPSFDGYGDHFPETILPGMEHTLKHTLVLSDDWTHANLHVIAILIAPDGSINNGAQATLSEVIAAGFDAGGEWISGVEPAAALAGPDVELYPNPTSGTSMLSVDLPQAATVSVTVTSINGQTVAARNYGTLQGTYQLPIETLNWEAGVYVVQLVAGNEVRTQKLVVR